nr:transposase [Enterocloster clostridioformis]
MICTGGGLDADRNWHQKKGGFFLPGKAMAALFKGKFLSGLKALHEAGKLSYEGVANQYRNQYEYQELLDICYGKNWVTDIRESFAGGRNLIGCREFLRRFKKDDKAQAIRILYKKDVTVCPCCGGAMSYKVCTKWTPQKSSA